MRNRYEGKCYNCGKKVKVGDGFFERRGGRWWVKHEVCAAPKKKKEILEAINFIHDQQGEILEKLDGLEGVNN